MSTGSKTILEGAAHISLPDSKVFYNPVQIFNRDLSVTVINQFCETYQKPIINVLEALSATGLRAVRYAKECPLISNITANDIDPEAAKLISRNIESNDCTEKIIVSCGDANLIMLQAVSNNKLFDIIDLDPYGSAAPFLDAAVQAVVDGGMLCITCTDMAALCASYSDACLAKYGSIPIKGDICHEFALRIILNAVERAAARSRRSVDPLLSCAIDFYARVFVRVRSSGELLKKVPLYSALLHRCPDCRYFQKQPLCRSLAKNERSFKIGPAPLVIGPNCPFCGGNIQIAGPFWSGPIHNPDFVRSVLGSQIAPSISTAERMKGMLRVCMEESELPNEVLYFTLNEISHTLRTPTPPLTKILYALGNGGYKAAISHCKPTGIKTDAPFEFLLKCFQSFVYIFFLFIVGTCG